MPATNPSMSKTTLALHNCANCSQSEAPGAKKYSRAASVRDLYSIALIALRAATQRRVQRSRQHNFTMARHRRGARRRVLAVVVAGANALQRTLQPPRRRTVRFSDAAPEAEAVEAVPETQMVAAPVETPEERAARDEDGPLKEFDWDAHWRGSRRTTRRHGRRPRRRSAQA